MRLARRTALLLAPGLVMTLGLVVGWHLSAGSTAHARATDETAFVQPDGLPAAAARLERDQRRESMASQRWTKHPLMLLAVVAALLASSALSVHRARASHRAPLPLTSWWFRSGGRAPPPFQLSVV